MNLSFFYERNFPGNWYSKSNNHSNFPDFYVTFKQRTNLKDVCIYKSIPIHNSTCANFLVLAAILNLPIITCITQPNHIYMEFLS